MAPSKLLMVKKRADFLRARNHGDAIFTKGFILQPCPNQLNHVRLGVTASKKLGNAVARNRVKRRLRELFRSQLCHPKSLLTPGYDYILIGRPSTQQRDFESLQKDLAYALHQLKNKSELSTTKMNKNPL